MGGDDRILYQTSGWRAVRVVNKRVDYSRLSLITGGLLAAGIVFFIYPIVHPVNHYAFGFVVTAFSIMAGIMIAVIATLGDPARLYRGSWRIASAHRRQIHRRLCRYELLFYVYLAVIGLACAAAIVDKIVWPGVRQWFARFALSAGTAAFVWSLGLPRAIIRTQMERLDEEVKRRRERGGEDQNLLSVSRDDDTSSIRVSKNADTQSVK